MPDAPAAVVAETVDVVTRDGTADALFCHPEAGGPHPGVLLFMDAYGLRPAVEAHARRLAGHGYCVFVPNLFYRSRRSPVLDDIEERITSPDRSALFEELKPMIAQVTPEAAIADGQAWLEFIRARAEVREAAIGTVGYCMGGRMSLRMAGEFADAVSAAASFHGGGLATGEDSSPHLAAVRAAGELYIGHADNDRSMPPEQMGRLTEALAEAHVRHTAELYPGAAHGWTQTDTPAYDEEASERHWMRLLELFGRVLEPTI
jgi:carboxymethylenebutenolidase